jgi:tetratricopeptide (TPR) repeat protein
MVRRGVCILLLLVGSARADDVQSAREEYRQGTRAFEVGSFDEAIEHFAAAYKLKDDPTILFNLAQAQRLAGRRSEALRTYRIYLSKQPNSPSRNEVLRIIDELSRISELAPQQETESDQARKHLEAGGALYRQKHYVEAITEYEAGRAIKPMPAFEYSLARCHDQLGHTDEALQHYRAYLRSNPSDENEIEARIAALEKPPEKPQPAVAPAVVAQPAEAPPPKKRRAWVTPVAVVAAVVVAGVAVGLGVGLTSGGGSVDPSPSLGQVHWK